MTLSESLFGDSASETETGETLLKQLTADVVGAYVSKNVVPMTELPNLIASVHDSLNKVGGQPAPVKSTEKPVSAVPIKKSIQKHAINCLECGKAFKSLRRHITANHELTVDEYREKWDLPASYPMVSPDYAEARSALAKQMGLGQSRKSYKGSASKAA